MSGARGALALAWVAITLGACGPGEPPPASEPERPHLIFISLDTLRADHLSCYGYERPTSPVLDALAQESVLFENLVAVAPSTGPSHMSMFSGVLPRVHGIYNGRPAVPTPKLPYLPEMLQAAGWSTVAFADGGIVTEAYGFDRGYDVFESRYEAFGTKLDDVEAWLADAPDEPTFLFVHTYGVHAPYLPARGHDLFTDPDFDGPLRQVAETLAEKRDRGELSDLAAVRTEFWSGLDRSDFSPEELAYLLGLYDGAIHGVDEQLGRLLAALTDKGWLDDAWLVVVSDHGEAFGEHGGFSHRRLHQEELWVPLIVRPPGGTTERRVAARVSALDLAPTLVELMALRPHPAMQGASLAPFDALVEDRVALATDGSQRADAVIRQGAKLIQPVKPGPKPGPKPGQGATQGSALMLFDLTSDPQERSNLVSEQGTAPGLPGLLGLLDAMREQAGALEDRLGEPIVDGAELSPERLQELRALGYLK